MNHSGPGWLPELILFSEHGGDWDAYLDAIYAVFREDFVLSRPEFNGTRLGLKRHPVIDGKEATFWHMISEGATEEERTPDFRRCERIGWPRPVIENEANPDVKIWKNKRRGETRINIWVENAEYLVVLAERRGFILPWTAFTVTRDHQKRKRLREYEKYAASPW